MKWFLILAAGIVGFYYLNQSGKRQYLASVQPNDATWQEVVKRFTPDEVNTVYEFFTKYSEANPVPNGSDLQKRLSVISTKYNIFT